MGVRDPSPAALEASSESARHSATSSAAEEDRPAPCSQIAADLQARAHQRNAGSPQLGGGAPHERAPALRAGDLGELELVQLVEVARVGVDALGAGRVGLGRLRAHDHALGDRERQREALVVVGVLADQVHAPGREARPRAHAARRIASPRLGGGLLGEHVGDERARALLGAGEVLELLGGAQRRIELDVQVPRPRGRAGGRSLVDDHHVGERPVEQRVVPARERLQPRGEQAQLLGLAVEQARAVLAQHHVRFVGPARRIRDVGDDGLVLVDDPPTVLELAAQQRARRAAAEARVGGELEPRHGRQERVAVDLPVGMVQRHADLDPAVLEDQHVLDVRARAELLVALAPDPHQRLGALGRERPERVVVTIGVHDHLRRPARRLEGGEAVLEHRDLEGGERDLRLLPARAGSDTAGSARARAGTCGPGGGSRRRPARRAARCGAPRSSRAAPLVCGSSVRRTSPACRGSARGHRL